MDGAQGLRSAFLAINLGILLAACNSSGSDDDNGEDNGAGNGNGNGETNGVETAELQGTAWERCGEFGDHETLTFNDATYEQVFRYYPNADCTGEPLPLVDTNVYEYDLGATVTSAEGVEARELDVRLVEINGDPQAEGGIVPGFDLIHATDSALVMGVERGFADPDNRPTQLDFDNAFEAAGNGTEPGDPDTGEVVQSLSGTWAGCVGEGDAATWIQLTFGQGSVEAVFENREGCTADGELSGTPTRVVFDYSVGQTLQTDGGVTANEFDAQPVELDGMPMDGPMQYDIVQVTATTLYFGAGFGDGSAVTDPADRPTQLDFDSPLDRVSP